MTDAYTRVPINTVEYPQYGSAVYGVATYGVTNEYTEVPKPTN